MDKDKIAVALRFFETKPENAEASLAKLAAYLDTAAQYPHVYVAVNVDADKCDSLAFIKQHAPSVTAFGVTPWQKFVAPMNALVYAATLDGNEVLASVSTEFIPKQEYIDALLVHLDDDTLVVGARCDGHDSNGGEEPIATGSSIPWNTFCVWNLRQLACLGFPLVGDGPFDPKMAGEEELTAVALQQSIAKQTGFAAKAKLVRVPNFPGNWDMGAWDERRLADHKKKMASKVERPGRQLEWLGLPAPYMIHIN